MLRTLASFDWKVKMPDAHPQRGIQKTRNHDAFALSNPFTSPSLTSLEKGAHNTNAINRDTL